MCRFVPLYTCNEVNFILISVVLAFDAAYLRDLTVAVVSMQCGTTDVPYD